MMNLKLELVCEEALLWAALPVDRGTLRALVECLWRRAGKLHEEGRIDGVPCAVTLALLTDGQIAAVNSAALGVPGPTNILSFPGTDYEDEAELALAVETLLRESVLYGQEPADHLVRLLAHGLLHVCGLDHGERMEACQTVLEEAGRAVVSSSDRTWA